MEKTYFSKIKPRVKEIFDIEHQAGVPMIAIFQVGPDAFRSSQCSLEVEGVSPIMWFLSAVLESTELQVIIGKYLLEQARNTPEEPSLTNFPLAGHS